MVDSREHPSHHNTASPVIDDRSSPDPGVLDELPLAVAITDREGRVTWVNQGWVAVAGDQGHVSRLGPGQEVLTHCRSAPGEEAPVTSHIADGLSRILAGRSNQFSLQYAGTGADESRWFLLNARSRAGGGLVLTHEETTVHHSVQDVLSDLAFHDAVTGLPNRGLLIDRLSRSLLRAQRHPMTPGVLFIDVDDFKAVNDRYGHATGDTVLIEVAHRLRSCIRDGDTCGRWGGDEFLVVVELTEAAALSRIRERIRLAFDAPITVGSLELDLTVSIGTVTAEPNGTVEELLANADERMYDDKRAHSSRLTGATAVDSGQSRPGGERE